MEQEIRWSEINEETTHNNTSYQVVERCQNFSYASELIKHGSKEYFNKNYVLLVPNIHTYSNASIITWLPLRYMQIFLSHFSILVTFEALISITCSPVSLAIRLILSAVIEEFAIYKNLQTDFYCGSYLKYFLKFILKSFCYIEPSNQMF